MEIRFEVRPPQPFLAIEAEATHRDLPQVIGGGFGELSRWLAEHGVSPVGAPFVRYLFVDDAENGPRTRLQIAFPVEAGMQGNSRVLAGTVPGGKFATHLHTGPWCHLNEVTAGLLDWARQSGVQWKRSPEDDRFWAARLEIYHDDPESQPDPALRRTELAFLAE